MRAAVFSIEKITPPHKNCYANRKNIKNPQYKQKFRYKTSLIHNMKNGAVANRPFLLYRCTVLKNKKFFSR